MKNNLLKTGILFITAFALWTMLVVTIDVQPVGQNGTNIGFAALNCCFHQLTGVHMCLYTITDWLGLVPVAVCLTFAAVGLVQVIRRKSVLKVDRDILWLGLYYIIVIIVYIVFEMIPINYRPVLINGIMEVSYPSSTTLLVLSVMPTLVFQINRRVRNTSFKKATEILSWIFMFFMVIGRMVSGVHWLTDIIGAVIFSAGMFMIYKAIVMINDNKKVGN